MRCSAANLASLVLAAAAVPAYAAAVTRGSSVLAQAARMERTTPETLIGRDLDQQPQLRADHGVNASAPLSWPVFLLRKVKEIPDALERISLDVSYSNVWEEVITFPERKPYSFNVVLATVKTFTADLIVQICSQRHLPKPVIDWRRSAAFATFGCLYVGLAQWFFYVSLFSVLCPHAIRFANEPLAAKIHDSVGQHELIYQVFYDNLILEAFIYFPVFYTIKEAILTLCLPSSTQPQTSADVPLSPWGQRNPFTTLMGILSKGLGTYRQNFFVDNSLSCAMWIPGDILIYSAPMFLRMPLDHVLAFAWTMGLSYMRGGGAPKEVPSAKEPDL